MGERPFGKEEGGKMKDEKIIEMFFERTEEAVSAVSEKYGVYCRTIAKNILKNEEDAEECVNDTFFRVWNSIPPEKPKNLCAFVGRITRNISLDRLKRDSAQKRGGGIREAVLSELEECIPDKTNVEAQFDENEFLNFINAFLYSRPEEKRNIFIRRYWYLQPVSQIAESYGIGESKVKSILFRMRKEMKKELEKEGIKI